MDKASTHSGLRIAPNTPKKKPGSLLLAKNSLRNGKTGLALWATRVALEEGRSLDDFALLFVRAKKVEELVDFLWRGREATLRRLSTAAKFLHLSAAIGQSDRYVPRLHRWLQDISTSQIRFSNMDILRRFARLDARALLVLFLAKYRGWETSDTLFENAENLAERCDIAESLASNLFQRRADRDCDFPQWFHELRSAQLVTHALRDSVTLREILPAANEHQKELLRSFLKETALSNLVDFEQTRAFFQTVIGDRPLLIALCHIGSVEAFATLCTKFVPGHYAVKWSGEPGWRRSAAFRAIKALQEKKVVSIGADAQQYGASAGTEITVFGVRRPISATSALLAYEADCATGWGTVMWRDGRLVPVFISGPKRANGENFDSFKLRWLSFYGARVEAGLSCEPRNLGMVSKMWSTLWDDIA